MGNSQTAGPVRRAAIAFAGIAAVGMVLLSLIVMRSEPLVGTASDPTRLMLGGGLVTVALGGVAAVATRHRHGDPSG